MSLWTKFTGWIVPPSALSAWTVPLRRVDSLKMKISPPNPNAQTLVDAIHAAGKGHRLKAGNSILINPLTWDGGLAPWTPNG